MKVCCVDGCDATAKEDITYFQFPIKPALRRKWRDAIRMTSKLSTESLVCSQHFTEDDIETARGRVRLKARVVPSIFHGNPKSPKEKTPDTNGNSDEHIENTVNENENQKDHKPAQSEHINEHASDKSEHADDRSEHADNKSEHSDDRNKDDDDKSEHTDNGVELSNNTKENEHKSDKNDQIDDHNENSVDGNSLHSSFLDNYFGDGNCDPFDDEDAEKCTVECVPEAILHEDSDSSSVPELNKEDIEDIIANYHIKQDKKLAERLKASITEPQNDNKNQNDDLDRLNSDKSGTVVNVNEKPSDKVNCDTLGGVSGKSVSDGNKDLDILDCDVVEVEFQPSESQRANFVEISVGDRNNDGGGGSPNNDCLMLLENVQVDIDPSLLLDGRDSAPSSPDEPRSSNPISLLTSSDESDVIIEEPHIDTIEVSDEDEDDMPLVKLVPTDTKKLTKLFWGSLNEYYCFQCNFKTTSPTEFHRHKQSHSKVLRVCEICNFTTASSTQFSRHKKKHKEEKRFKCHLCEYKARHNMSLIYHMKSHDLNLNPYAEVPLRNYIKQVKVNCKGCKKGFASQKDLLLHNRYCKTKMYSCNICLNYTTKRKGDLKRHKTLLHTKKSVKIKTAKKKLGSGSDDDEDYIPGME